MVVMFPERGTAEWSLNRTDRRQMREWLHLPEKAKVPLLHHHYHCTTRNLRFS